MRIIPLTEALHQITASPILDPRQRDDAGRAPTILAQGMVVGLTTLDRCRAAGIETVAVVACLPLDQIGGLAS